MSYTMAKELREKRAGMVKEAEQIRDSAVEAKRQMTDEEATRFNKILDDTDALLKQAEDIEAGEARLAKVQESLAQKQERLAAMKEFGAPEKSAEEVTENTRKAFRNFLRSVGSEEDQVAEARREYAEAIEAEQRALGQQLKGTAGKGGTWVPTEFEASVIEGMKAYGGMRAVAEVFTTSDGRNLDIPTYDDTGNEGKIVAEASTAASTHVPVAKVTMESVKYGTGVIQLSSEIIQDAAVDIEAVVRRALAQRMGRITEKHFATRSSTETAGPHGLTSVQASSNAAVTFVVSAGSSNLTYAKLLELVHDVDPAHRQNATWMFNDNTLRVLRAKVDGDLRPLWQAGLTSDAPATLLGFPYQVNQSLTQTITTKAHRAIWFGDFKSYAIRDVRGFALRVLNERYADRDMIGIVGFLRTDGRALFANTVVAEQPLQCIRGTSA